MADNSRIEWTEATWTIMTGCTKVSPGCANCYAKRDWGRLSANPTVPKYFGRDFGDVRFHPELLDQPVRWARPRRIFVPSMGDVFHESVPDAALAAIFGIMLLTPRHTFQVLTKRAERMGRFLRQAETDGIEPWLRALADHGLGDLVARVAAPESLRWPAPHVWIGVSAEDQERANARIPILLRTPATVRWVSAEPLLGALRLEQIPVDRHTTVNALAGTGIDWIGAPRIPNLILPRLDWVVVGGESGPKARAMDPAWVASLRAQCERAGVAFLFKQWGEWGPAPEIDGSAAPGTTKTATADSGLPLARLGRARAGRLLDGRLWDQYPEPDPTEAA